MSDDAASDVYARHYYIITIYADAYYDMLFCRA